LALLEFNSISAGIEAGDAMVKHAPVAQIQAGTVQPGHYLVLLAGNVASVEEAVKVGKVVARSWLRDWVFLPNVHPAVVTALTGERTLAEADALGVVETKSVAVAIEAADAGVKGAEVTLLQLRLADGLGGKGLVFFAGLVADVETALALATAVTKEQLIRQAIIPQLDAEMWANVNSHGRFGGHFNWEAS
jgi:microcompartment protein CcmL/EutN